MKISTVIILICMIISIFCLGFQVGLYVKPCPDCEETTSYTRIVPLPDLNELPLPSTNL